LFLHVLVEQASSGHFIASVPELPDCVAEAETRSDAFPFGVAEGIAIVQQQIKSKLANIYHLFIPKSYQKQQSKEFSKDSV
jgi:hypothetical protein